MNKKALSERDICTKFITPAIVKAGWNRNSQIREEVSFTAGKVIVRGKLVSRGNSKRADYILYYKNIFYNIKYKLFKCSRFLLFIN